MIKIKKFVFNPFYINTYTLYDDISRDAIIIDAGCLHEDEREELLKFVDENNLNIKYLINTHCHLDHLFGANFVKKMFSPKFYVPKNDLLTLESYEEQSKAYGLIVEPVPQPDGYLDEDTELELAGEKIQVIFTPGHTIGEVCFYIKRLKICFSGDVLFEGNIGRTDLPGGNYEDIIESIRTKLFTLPDDVIVYPGHGNPTTIKNEKLFNQFLN